MAVNPIPDGFRTVTPYLIVKGAAGVIDFAKRVFGAMEMFRSEMEDGSIMHATFRVGDSIVEVADASAKWTPRPGSLHVYVADTDATYKRAIEAGGKSLFEPMDMFYGERSGGVEDPAGNHWYIATHIEDVPLDELERRAKEFKKGSSGV
jgi:uncharacterized glyoxalase superfamily protein PhnB